MDENIGHGTIPDRSAAICSTAFLRKNAVKFDVIRGCVFEKLVGKILCSSRSAASQSGRVCGVFKLHYAFACGQNGVAVRAA